MESSAVSYGAATVVAAFASGKGGAVSTQLKTFANVNLTKGKKIEAEIIGGPKEDTTLLKACVKRTLDFYGFNFGCRIETESDIPIARGLKSSSAAANAACLAVAGALCKEHGHVEQTRLGKSPPENVYFIGKKRVDALDVVKLGVAAAFDAKVTVTGAFDDAAASMLGGFVLTDNAKNVIVRRGEMEELPVIIHVPKMRSYSGKVDLSRLMLLKREVDFAWEEARKGGVYTALTLNGILTANALNLSTEPIFQALDAGAIAAGISGKGPSTVAISRKPEDVVAAWSKLPGKIIVTKLNNKKAEIL
ncbi:Shikimate kinase [uncultured archaeon]|nr:Shikimate kinase [uncultured archaeon]